ncbi:TauD/TfdA family dioxygenase [Nonomuraea sp. SYSU D8015]|uniref:TauD/TfdA family dioxygenase n=1 Tax=Nonomuraea sp. SYSU D8015 TaxID=2593644 RepID=UPI0016607CB4|nr:TauD/TfdA family dioxygenase [Nonomuraea sp. SYSU D8015]
MTESHRPDTGLVSLTLADDVRDDLQQLLLHLPDPARDVDDAMTRTHQIFARLPLAVLREILDFGRHVDTPAVMMVSNLPTDPELPPTPTDGGSCAGKPTFVAEGVLLGLSGLLGEPVGFVTEKDGRIVHDITPTAAGAATQTSQGSKVFLNFHNDIVHDPGGRYDITNPDFLVLNCLRSDPHEEAETWYADGRDILRVLDEDVIEVLRSPLFQLNAPGGYVRMFAAGKEVYSDPIAIVSGPDHSPEIAVAANGVRCLSSAASEAFDRLQAACRHPDVARVVRLAPGQALLVNNRKGLHARTQFTARYDGRDRWLQRTYIRRSLWNIRGRAAEGSRRVHL